jgi:cyclic pyranopterin phosphate synthase
MPRSPVVPYLRVIVTTRCPLACTYCHAEGSRPDAHGELPLEELVALLNVAVSQGVRKIKLLGGEPLARKDLPELIAAVARPGLDLSLITSGAVRADRVDACFAAGLTRANLSIHGWTEAGFAARAQRPHAYALRAAVIARLLAHGRFLKLNYVWRGPGDDADLAGLLAWAAEKPVTIGLLDELSLGLGHRPLLEALNRLRGPWASATPEPDPNSLPTTILRWHDGLSVEVKDHRLGDVSPWKSCTTCPLRARCGEGVHALRLTHTGELKPCMDRADLGVDLRAALRAGNAANTWTHFLEQACA